MVNIAILSQKVSRYSSSIASKLSGSRKVYPDDNDEDDIIKSPLSIKTVSTNAEGSDMEDSCCLTRESSKAPADDVLAEESTNNENRIERDCPTLPKGSMIRNIPKVNFPMLLTEESSEDITADESCEITNTQSLEDSNKDPNGSLKKINPPNFLERLIIEDSTIIQKIKIKDCKTSPSSAEASKLLESKIRELVFQLPGTCVDLESDGMDLAVDGSYSYVQNHMRSID